ncbi:MAG: hypothetical protein ACRETW_06840 [Stenotrophobium sp.]
MVESFSVRGQPLPPELGEQVLRWLDLSQSQVASLLGLTPQAISKGLKDEGIAFLSQDRRVHRLYQALSSVGGDRYALVAFRLKELAREVGWGTLEALQNELVRPEALYAEADELWIVSDAPGSTMNWEALRSQLFKPHQEDQHKVFVFFMRTLEAAERWAEILERELIKPAVRDQKIRPDEGKVMGAHVFLIVTNALAFSQDFVVANPGSRCMGILSSTRPAAAYHWLGASYAKAPNPSFDFVRLAQHVGLGMASVKSNFFPSGIPLKPEVMDFKPTFIDGLIAVRGETAEEDSTPAGEKMAGGILATPAARSEHSLQFNKRTKFCPVFVMTYRRRPGESFNKAPTRILKVIQEEFDRQASEGDIRGQPPSSFW